MHSLAKRERVNALRRFESYSLRQYGEYSSMVELWLVVPEVMGSMPITHPKFGEMAEWPKAAPC